VTAREHGTRARYHYGPDENETEGRGCRCRACRAGNAARAESRRRAIAYGRYQPWGDIQAVRDHIGVLRASGISLTKLAELAELTVRCVHRLDHPCNGRPQTIRVTAETARQILAVRPSLDQLDDWVVVDASGSRRRLQALVAIGHCQSALGHRLGLPPTLMTHVMSQPRMIARKARAVRALYDELWNVPPDESTPAARAGVKKALRMAEARGWAPPMAWDDDTIDDPAAGPAGGWQRRSGKLIRAVELAEDAAFVREHGGYRNATSEQVAMRLGVKRDALDKAIARSGRAS
jgi:hypothetical protein